MIVRVGVIGGGIWGNYRFIALPLVITEEEAVMALVIIESGLKNV